MSRLLFITALMVTSSPLLAKADEGRKITIHLTVPSTAYQVKIREVYQTPKELWVLSKVSGGGIGATVITKRQDSVTIKAPDLPVKHFVLGKTWNWKKENYRYLRNKKVFEKMVVKAGAKKIYSAPKSKKAGQKGGARRYIVMYSKDIFLQNGKTAKGESLEDLAKRHAKQFHGKFGRTLRIIHGFTVTMTPKNAAKLRQLPEVRNVEADRVIGIPSPRIRPQPPVRIRPLNQ